MSRRIAVRAGGVAAVLLVAWFLLLWSPQGRQLDGARQRQEAADVAAGELRARLVALRADVARVPELQQTRDALRAALPEAPDLSRFLVEVDGVARDTRVELLSLTPSEPKVPEAGGPASIAVVLRANGGYQAVVDFLDRLQGLPRVLVIDSVQATPQDDGRLRTFALTLGGRLFTTQTPAAPDAGAPASTPVPGEVGAKAP